MSFITDRIDFMLDTSSLDDVSDSTGIDVNTVEQLYTGEIQANDSQYNSIRAAYQRDAYKRLGDSGFSTNQANRFRAYSPNSVRDRMQELTDKLSYLRPAMLKHLGVTDWSSLTEDDQMQLGILADEMLRESIRNSPKPYEVWIKYGGYIQQI